MSDTSDKIPELGYPDYPVVIDQPEHAEYREFTVLIRGKVRQVQEGKKVTAKKIRRQVSQSIIMDPMEVISFGDIEVIVKR